MAACRLQFVVFSFLEHIFLPNFRHPFTPPTVFAHSNKVYHLPCGDLCGETVPTLSVPKEEYLGCFNDEGEDRLFTFKYSSSTDMKASVSEK